MRRRRLSGHPGVCCDAVDFHLSALFLSSRPKLGCHNRRRSGLSAARYRHECRGESRREGHPRELGHAPEGCRVSDLRRDVHAPRDGGASPPRDPEFPGALNSPRAPNVPRLTPVPPARYPTTDGVPALVLPRVYRQDRAARPGNDQRVPHVRHQAREQPVRGEKSRQRSSQGEHRGQAEGFRGVGWERRWGCGGGGSARTAGGGGARTRGSSSGGSRTGGCRAGTRGARAGARGC